MAICEQDTQDKPRSNNAKLANGRWHEPDYSQSSGFNVIDFPVHYSFSNVGNIQGLFNQDNYYNDATYNVVYVDSHDYAPGPNDGIRFNGGTAQWAENLSFMFTFRGIPCIYYGSEVEFKKGCPIDVGGENNKTPRSDSGRAYFGNYLEGNVTASDFGVYTASGNVAKTLDADLAQHVRRLNQIRAAVPALRKGQYTYDGCSANGGWAFKRGYKNESYACVAVNGGGTFTNLPAGTYTEIITGKQYTIAEGGSITLDAPKNQGQLRVAVRNWTGSSNTVGEDGKFIYKTSPVPHGGSVEFADPGTTQYYTAEDAPDRPCVKFNPAGGSFKTETLTVTATLSDVATSGWFQIANGTKFNLAAGESKTFTVGDGMSYGQSVDVTWSATDGSMTMEGKATYKKLDPNAVTTIFVTGKDGADISGTHLHAWNDNGNYTGGSWPGVELTDKVMVDNREFYTYTLDTNEPVNIIFNRNNGSVQTGDITGVEGDAYFEYDGGTNANRIEVVVGPQAPTVVANPASGKTFTESLTVSLSVSPATDIYYTLDGSQANGSSTKYTGPITLTETTTINTYVKNEVGEKRQSFTYTKVEAREGITIYVTGKNGANISGTNLYAWNGSTEYCGKWPGKTLTETTVVDGKTFYYETIDTNSVNVIFNKSGQQSGNFEGLTEDTYFEYDGEKDANKIDVVVGPKKPVVTANPASGKTFTESLAVSLSVSPATDIYYTLDGSQANGASTKYTGPITLTETTTINTYAKNEAGENRQSFTYTKSEVVVPTGDHVVYFLNSGNWNDVYAYCWDDEHQEGNSFSGSKWPGKKLTETVVLDNTNSADLVGKSVYKFSFNYEPAFKNAKIIFNCGNDSGKTKDYNFVDGGIYRHDQNEGDEPFAFFSTGVSSVKANADVKVYVENGTLVVEADADCVIPAVRLDGTARRLNLNEGLNYFELPKGFYIIAGKKVII